MRSVMAQASLHIRAVSPEPSLFAHTIYESWGSFKQRAGDLAPLDSYACVFEGTQDTKVSFPVSWLIGRCEVQIENSLLEMSLVTRKPVLGVCDQVRLKPACSADETS